MRALVFRFLEHLDRERNYSPHTLRAYAGDLERFLDFLAGDYLGRERAAIRPADADGEAVRSFLAWLARRGTGRRSQGRALAAVRGLFRYACREGVLATDPSRGIRTPKAPKRIPEHLRPGEVESLLEAPEGDEPLARRDRALLELLYATGLRVSELVSLDWSDLDLGRRVLRVVGKGARRMVPVRPPGVRPQPPGGRNPRGVAPRARRSRSSERRGERLTDRSVRRRLDRAVAATALARGVPPARYCATFATHLLERGADLRTIRKLLGASRSPPPSRATPTSTSSVCSASAARHPAPAARSENRAHRPRHLRRPARPRPGQRPSARPALHAALGARYRSRSSGTTRGRLERLRRGPPALPWDYFRRYAEVPRLERARGRREPPLQSSGARGLEHRQSATSSPSPSAGICRWCPRRSSNSTQADLAAPRRRPRLARVIVKPAGGLDATPGRRST